MRILYFTDSQLIGTPPLRRVDNFGQKVLDKLAWLLESTTGQVDMVLCGGDLFDAPNPAEWIVSGLLSLVNKHNLLWWIVPGNHDLPGGFDTVKRSALGILDEHPLVHVLTPGRVAEVQCGGGSEIPVAIYPVDARIKTRAELSSALACASNATIAVVHWSVTPEPVSPVFGETVTAERLHQFVSGRTKFQWVLCGHWHEPFGISRGGVRVLNPGPLGRTTIKEAQHRPSGVLIDTEVGTAEWLTVPGPCPEDFDLFSKAEDDATAEHKADRLAGLQMFEALLESAEDSPEPLVIFRRALEACNFTPAAAERAEQYLTEVLHGSGS